MAVQTTLPQRVLDDARTCGFIDADGICALVNAGFAWEAIYPMAKAHDDSPRRQEYFFTLLMSVLKENDEYALVEFLKAEAGRMAAADAQIKKRNLACAIKGSLTREPLSVRVRSPQLVQWNRMNGNEWHEHIKHAAWTCYRKGIEPVLVAYAVLVALPPIIRRIGGCYILNPGWIGDPGNPWCGLCLSSDSTPAVLISKGEELTADPYILDDTIRTGDTLNDLRRYLASCGNLRVTPHMLWDARNAEHRALFPVDGSAVLEWTE